ncbi:hypothetical protein AB1Y20_010212 [Prymnesium parvum]|uniref:Apple domain-containing protein n=1 Tax=Prymnesium parvum TaxID=97485 RepID=A0AB34K4H8_PRYPA
MGGQLRRRRRPSFDADAYASGYPSLHGLSVVGNSTGLELPALVEWLEARHRRLACSWDTPVYFAPFSPNGIGNKLMAMAMAFHIALMTGRALVVTDWPPATLATSYKLDDLLLPSSCQPLFDGDPSRPAVRKCTIASCPLHTASRFTRATTQMHWAHQSPHFLRLPAAWAHLDWLVWWRAITQYLFQPSGTLLRGLASSLAHTTLLRSPRHAADEDGTPRLPTHRLLLLAAARGNVSSSSPPPPSSPSPASTPRGFAHAFASSVAAWGEVRRPLIGAHVRLGDGCGDAKRGGCKYVRSLAHLLTRLREAGVSRGTIFLATDSHAFASEAMRAGGEGYDILTLRVDRERIQRSHARSERRKEGDDLLHLQLLDLALLAQADVLAGVFASTFVKSALQLGAAASYVSFDTFPWCPLLRCYWGWRDLCHNCELCHDQSGGGEACVAAGYHTAAGLAAARRDRSRATSAFRRHLRGAEAASRCPPLADHPLHASLFAAPVSGTAFAPAVPPRPFPQEVCASGGDVAAEGGANCSCGFRRFRGVDNAAAAARKPVYGYGVAKVRLGARATLAACEAACCAEATCHSVTWDGARRACVASLAIAYGARRSDWCWRPTLREGATTSIRLPGEWQREAIAAAAAVMEAARLVRRGEAAGLPREFRKRRHWRDPAGHSHPLERSIEGVACEAPRLGRGAVEVSDMVIDAIPLGDPRPGKGNGGRGVRCGGARSLRGTLWLFLADCTSPRSQRTSSGWTGGAATQFTPGDPTAEPPCQGPAASGSSKQGTRARRYQ